ncbi:trypsin-like peptidase domain-containing protein [Halomonas smyrnensis]|uniref:trypsin-like peptidase domain-containing protein n=1 Tax=Halomonas smyrnensis TaxID=720605 RepID=UPI000A003160|nr:trypsin-like peptidase domain-containing protein [Halomonas smyrnensis]
MEVASLAECLFFNTIRVDTEDNEGATGSGTSFAFNHWYKGKNYPFLVTNKHVVKDAEKGGLTFIKKNGDGAPALGEGHRLNFRDFKSAWFNHPSDDIDVCVTPLFPLISNMQKHGVEIFYKAISTEHIPNENQIKDLDAYEEVVFVGYPNGIWDKANLLPIMRKGTTATPFSVDYEGEKKFLIDASVFGGSSGSPVFIYNSGTYGTKSGEAMMGTKFYFIGVVASVYFKTNAKEVVELPVPTSTKSLAVYEEMIDLGVVFKADAVRETIEFAIESQER